MRLYILIVLILLTILDISGQDQSSFLVDKNYNGQSFEEMAIDLSEQRRLQFYYFSGWVKDVIVKQSKTPASIDEILTGTLADTDYKYVINDNGQVILSIGEAIKSAFTVVDSASYIKEVPVTISSLGTGVTSQLENISTDWIIIGDPSSPEQKPQVTLSGYVTNRDTGEPLEGALLYVEELKTGTATDSAGYYEMDMRQGRYSISYQSIGLKESNRKIQLYAGGQVDIELGELVMNIEEVVVRAFKKDNVDNVQMGVEALSIETIKELPSLMGEVDIVRSALMLPGVQSVGEFSSGINVRGGGADQNLILINGAPVFNASHLFGFSSSFSPDVVEGFELYKSSIPVKYGGRISSVLEIDMKEGDDERWTLRGGISPITSRITAEGPINDRTTFIASGRATYSDWILGRIQNASFRNSKANYQDFTARVKTKIAKNDFLDVSTYVSNDAFRLNGDTTFAYQNFNVIANYQHSFSDRLFGTLSLIHSQYRFNVDSEKQPLTSFDLFYKIRYSEAKAHFSYAPDDKHQVNYGLNIVHYNLSPGDFQPKLTESVVQPISLENEKAIEGSIYISDQWDVSDKLSVYGGLRYTLYSFLGPRSVFDYRADAPRLESNIIGTTEFGSGEIVKQYGGLEYRTSLRYGIDDNTSVKASFNRNRQYLSMLFNSATVSPTATWKLSDTYIKPQTGDQVSIGIFKNLMDDKLELSVEGYYKKIQNMVDYKAGAELALNDHIETDVVNGEGRAYGVEVLLKKNGRKLNGWLSYTFSRTRFRAQSEFPEDQINEGDWFATNFDKPHDFSFVGYYKISRRVSVSSNMIYSTGRPVTIPVAKYLFANGTRLQYSRRNEFRVPDQFRWDLSLNLEGNHKRNKLAHSSWSLSVYNVTGRKNVYSVYFVSDGSDAQGYKLSIFGRPIVTLTYNFRF